LRRIAVGLSLAVVMTWLGSCGGSTDVGGTGGSDAGTAYDSCEVNSDCVISSASCCGQCGAATRDDIIALAKDAVGAYGSAKCGDAFGCPACYMAQDASLIATCSNGHCAVVDLLVHDSTSCAVATDCRIRTNVCCECGGPTDGEHLVAISNESLFQPLVCDPLQACPECAPVYPSEYSADCSGGHCIAKGPSF